METRFWIMLPHALFSALTLALPGQAAPRVAMLGKVEQNAFVAAARELGISLQAVPAPRPADFDALLVCALDYPQVRPLNEGPRRTLEAFLAADKAAYVEFTPLPGLMGDRAQEAGYERLVVTGNWLGQSGLPDLAVLEEHTSRYLPVLAAANTRTLLRYAKVAGMDHAVFGLPEQTAPGLVEVRPPTGGRLLLAATALSNWQRGRYRPTRAWAALTRETLLALLPAGQAQAARRHFIDPEAWTEPRDWVASGERVRLWVRAAGAAALAAAGPGGEVKLTKGGAGLVSEALALPDGRHEFHVTARVGDAERRVTVPLVVSPRAERYRQAVARNLRWFEKAGMLISPDGSRGVREGLSSYLGPDGKPTLAEGQRVDCISECGLLFQAYGRRTGDQAWLQRGERMLEYAARAFPVTSQDCWYFGHWQSRGEFHEDGGTVYVFNDDSGAGTLFSLLGYAATGDREQLRAGLRGAEYFCHIASDKTGLFGSMPHRDWEGSGRLGIPWPVLRAQEIRGAAPHVMNLPLAALLVAHGLTGEPRYLQIAERGIRTLMADHPFWQIVTSRTCEHGRMLLPLALLVALQPTPEHRQWLDTVVDYLVGKQAPCGAIAEWDGYNPRSNADFGTSENSVFQQNGDPISDQLYGTGFALLHLGLAYGVTGDERIKQAYERLGDYLTRIQLRDPDPLYDGTWLRAFDCDRWEYFGSSADVGWGPYCSETGWMCAPIGLGLLMEAGPGGRPTLPEYPDPGLQGLVRAARQEADAVEAALSAPPTPVQGLRAEASRGPYASLLWDTPPARALTYRVYRSDQPAVELTPANLAGTSGTGRWAEGQLRPMSDYYYRVVAANGLGQTGPATDAVKVHTGPVSKARGCPYTKAPPPDAAYPDINDQASTDGVYAGAYGDRKSYGYRLAEVGDEITVTVTVDLGKTQQIARASHHNCGAAGYRPDRMTVWVSVDGQSWTQFGATGAAIGGFMVLDFAPTEARFVRFDFTKRRTAGQDDWLFLDELEVF